MSGNSKGGGKKKGGYRQKADPRVARLGESLGLLKQRVLGQEARLALLERFIEALADPEEVKAFEAALQARMATATAEFNESKINQA